jgi:hypothetical protein
MRRLLKFFQPWLCRYGYHPIQHMTIESWFGVLSRNLTITVRCDLCGHPMHVHIFRQTDMERM